MGENTEHQAFTYFTSSVEYYVGMLEKLSGIVFVSKITTSKYGQTSKSTFISYNHGNTFVPLYPANQSRICEWPTCQIYIPPNENSIFDSFKFAKDYPLVMAGLCAYIENGYQKSPKYMISYDGGYTWNDVDLQYI
ncbi:hypothetical protein RF11_15176 [Thelohanellus kitauei]|uniref:Sortilin N-terminal domain-containing protein n=1 Tax=Thelohanellus kitauei TaxID=669202 RepID=A0A0C2JTE4_THEKT|nr:hypothetical protein RF11_15176 [Thelohanellus kitauei]